MPGVNPRLLRLWHLQSDALQVTIPFTSPTKHTWYEYIITTWLIHTCFTPKKYYYFRDNGTVQLGLRRKPILANEKISKKWQKNSFCESFRKAQQNNYLSQAKNIFCFKNVSTESRGKWKIQYNGPSRTSRKHYRFLFRPKTIHLSKFSQVVIFSLSLNKSWCIQVFC